uniref:Protein kinase domain-containing protein n=1 Tax=Ditylenchus dipsaci TaxID=166011 RepID=A0A915EGW5_9BILA
MPSNTNLYDLVNVKNILLDCQRRIRLQDITVRETNTYFVDRFLHSLNSTYPLCMDKMELHVLSNLEHKQTSHYYDSQSLLKSQALVGEFLGDVGIKTVIRLIGENKNASKTWKLDELQSASDKMVQVDFLDSSYYLDKSYTVFWYTTLIAFCVILSSTCGGLFVFFKRRQRRALVNSLFKGGGPSDNYYMNRFVDPNTPCRPGQHKNTTDEWEIPTENLNVFRSQQLGSGAFAFVYKGQLVGRNPLIDNRNINYMLEEREKKCNEVAIKVLRNSIDERNRLDLWRELEFMKELGYHPHILNLIGYVFDMDAPLLVLEYCALGDLLTLIRNNRQALYNDCGVVAEEKSVAKEEFQSKEQEVDENGTEDKTKEEEEEPKFQPVSAKKECNLTLNRLISFSWQISDAMVYLSSQNHIHRDIAARNVLITGNMVAKLGDFGLCRHSVEQLYTTQGGKMPIKWMALEALKVAEFSSKTDVWAFGVLLFEVFSGGDTPYPTIQASDMLDHLQNGNRLPQPILCPDEIYKLMKECWQEDPDKRPTCEQVRKKITKALESSTESYGYVDFRSPEYLKYSELHDSKKKKEQRQKQKHQKTQKIKKLPQTDRFKK